MTEYVSIQSSQDVIEHYGIKGMRWGIKSRNKELRNLDSIYKNQKKLVRTLNSTLGSTPSQRHGYALQFKGLRNYKRAQANRAVLQEIKDSGGNLNSKRAKWHKHLAEKREKKHEKLMNKASYYMNR